MLTKRIIPCLDIDKGRVVKGVNFVDLIDAGDPIEIAKKYNAMGADEIVFLDITATHEGRGALIDVIKRAGDEVFIPLTVGGGVKSIEDFSELLNSGADKISINSSAVKNPDLINAASAKFGSQCVVVAMDVKKFDDGKYYIYLNGGRIKTDIEAVSWAKECADRGAGEILLTSMDCDGTQNGYELSITKAISEAVNIPVIASGGAGKMIDFYNAFTEGKADACLAASLFHFDIIKIKDLKDFLKAKGIAIRI